MDHIGRLDIRDLAIGRRSALTPPWRLESPKELTKEDLVLLLANQPADAKAPLARISAPHHMLAKLIAEGGSDPEVSGVTGYSTLRIKTLKKDPAFQELIAYYEGEHIKATANVTAQITHIALTAGQLLQEKLEDSPEEFTKKELTDLWSKGLDRIGHGPTSKHTIDVNDPSHVIDKLQTLLSSDSRSRVLSREDALVIDATYTEVSKDDKISPDPGPQEGNSGAQGPVPSPSPEGPGGGGSSLSD